MNSTLQNSANGFETHNPYQIYQLHLIASYYPEAPLSLEIGRDLKALGFSLRDWYEATAQSVDLLILSRYWESFLYKEKVEASCHLDHYIVKYFKKAEDRMGEVIEAEDREAIILFFKTC